jgi:hypothetical protein
LATVTVPSRFNGPPASGNGGYSCGAFAAHLDGPAAVSLRRPVPLDQPLAIRLAQGEAEGTLRGKADADEGAAQASEDGVARAYDAAGELVAEAVPAAPLAPWDTPPIDLEAAHRAKSRYAAPAEGVFAQCFVCGLARHDGLCVFTGPVAGSDLVAAPWTPPAWTAGEDGAVLPEFVWAALDCPAYFALHGDDLTVAFLARQQSEVLTPLRAGVEYIAASRPLERSGRKGLAATAILDADGEVLAHGECLFVVPREGVSHK